MKKEDLIKATEIQTKIEAITTSITSVKDVLNKGNMPELFLKFNNQKNLLSPLFLAIPDNLSYKIIDMVLWQLEDDLKNLNSQFEKL